MPKSAKIAVSMPRDTLVALDRACRTIRKTRSAAVTEAVKRWLSGSLASAEEEQYVRGYLMHPERSGTAAAVAREAIESWEPWDDSR